MVALGHDPPMRHSITFLPGRASFPSARQGDLKVLPMTTVRVVTTLYGGYDGHET